jgi:menaquinol-cytochrome c reductase cytochrome b subunit
VDLSSSAPILGPYVADFLRGGSEFTATTLSRFYAIHMLIIPGVIAAMIVAHLYLVVKLGTVAPPWIKAERGAQNAVQERAARPGGAYREGVRQAPTQRPAISRRRSVTTRSG